MRLDLPVGVSEDGNLLRRVVNVDLAVPAREMLTELTYYTPLTALSGMSATVIHRINPGNMQAPSEAIAAVRYSLRF